MGDETVRMPFADVRRHAGAVDDASDGTETARSATAQVQLGDQAYGMLCQFLPGLLDLVANSAVTAMATSVSALSQTAGKLRTAAGGHESTDHASGDRVAATGRQITLPL
jgi:hypothetical protein